MTLGLVRCLGLQARSRRATWSSLLPRSPQLHRTAAAAGERRLLSSSAATSAPPRTAAAEAGVDSQSQLHRGKKSEGGERKLWPYIKAAKQQFFNVVLATLSVVMAAKMVEGKGKRVALEEEIAELERREKVLLRGLSDESWAEGVAKRIGASGGKAALLAEIEKVATKSMLDKESAELEAMKVTAAMKAAAAMNPSMETAAAVGGEGEFGNESRKDVPSSGVATPGGLGRMM